MWIIDANQMSQRKEWRRIDFVFGIMLLALLPSTTQEKVRFSRKTIKHEPQGLIGITIQEQQAPLFYDTFFTVLYELDIPTWNASNVKLDLTKNLNGLYQGSRDLNKDLCKKPVSPSDPVPTTSSYNGTMPDLWEVTLCPIKRKFDELLETFAQEMKMFETLNASVSKLDSHFSSCHDIKPHFSNHIIDELEIELYLAQVILDCPISDLIHHKLNVSLPDKGKYTEVLNLFVNTYILPRFRLIGFPKFAIPTNTLLTLQSSHLIHYLLDTFQWTTSINTCNDQRIPRLLISPDILTTTLQEVQQKISKQDMDLRLTIPIVDYSNYYKLKLADCVMTSSNKYIIRMLVPLTKASANYKQVSIRSIPFLNKDTNSDKTMICHHKILEGIYIVDGITGSQKPIDLLTACVESEICRVPAEGDRTLYTRCLHSAFMNETDKMLEHCRMSCVPYDPINLPFVKRVRSDQFVVVGRSSADVAVICKNEENKPIPIDNIPEDIGSVLVTVPCGCYLSHRSVKYEINGPCEFTLEILPVHPRGISYDSFLERYFHHHLQNISAVFANALINKTLVFDDYDGSRADRWQSENDSVSHCPTWPIYIAYVILLVGAVFFVMGFFVLRNVYVRIGQMEMSTGKSGARPSNGYLGEPQFSRNLPVSFNVRGSAPFGSTGDPVY